MQLLVKCYDIKMVKLPRGSSCRNPYMQLTNKKNKKNSETTPTPLTKTLTTNLDIFSGRLNEMSVPFWDSKKKPKYM